MKTAIVTPLGQEFLDYHEDNPHIYEKFKEYAFEAIHSGRPRISGEVLISRMRWFSAVEAEGYEEGLDYKINSRYIPFYTRMFEQDFPEHRDFFTKRGAEADLLFPREEGYPHQWEKVPNNYGTVKQSLDEVSTQSS